MRLPNRKYPNTKKAQADFYMTQAKFDALQKKLQYLIKHERPQAAQDVADLAHDGDFSENAGYQAAKGKLRGINSLILKLENIIKQAQIISTIATGANVQIGSSVTIEINGLKKTFTILGASESNPQANIISHNSPVGKALLGHRAGDEITIQLKDKKVKYKIIAIK